MVTTADDYDDLHAALGRVGVEIELLAPPGVTRAEVAAEIAADLGGVCRPVFSPGTEPSKRVPTLTLHNLSLGTAVVDDAGTRLCHVVDDMTIRDGLSPELSTAGDYRIITDDIRLARLISRQCDPEAPLDEVLRPVVELFGGTLRANADGTRQMAFVERRSLATALVQLHERRRVCEIVTGVLDGDHEAGLRAVLDPAIRMGCVVPTEAAVHVHFDAEPFRRADRFAALVELFGARGEELKKRFGTNPDCRHLGPLPKVLVQLVRTPGFATRPWAQVEELIESIEFHKYRDLNLKNLRHRTPGKDTVEVRILPGAIDPAAIAAQIAELRRVLAGPG